jgi:hypothetical protein
MLVPPREHIRINLLILYPLLARMFEAEVSCLGPGGKMVDLIPLRVVVAIKRALHS